MVGDKWRVMGICNYGMAENVFRSSGLQKYSIFCDGGGGEDGLKIEFKLSFHLFAM